MLIFCRHFYCLCLQQSGGQASGKTLDRWADDWKGYVWNDPSIQNWSMYGKQWQLMGLIFNRIYNPKYMWYLKVGWNILNGTSECIISLVQVETKTISSHGNLINGNCHNSMKISILYKGGFTTCKRISAYIQDNFGEPVVILVTTIGAIELRNGMVLWTDSIDQVG